MTVEEAKALLDDAVDEGLNVTVTVLQPDPQTDLADAEPTARVRVAAPAHLPVEKRRISEKLIKSAIGKGQLPQHADLVLE